MAALFALHPLHVESVAWVAERKDVLSTFFFLLTLWAYARYAEKSVISNQWPVISGEAPGVSTTDHRLLNTDDAPRTTRHAALFYVMALGCFALGLMSKPMLVTVPFVLLLLDYWPLKRMMKDECRMMNPESGAPDAPAASRTSSFIIHNSSFVLLEKLPFLLLSLGSCLVTVLAQKKAIQPLANLSVGVRLGNALVAYVRYLGKTFWPFDLATPYPHPGHWPLAYVLLSAALLCAISVAVLVFGGKVKSRKQKVESTKAGSGFCFLLSTFRFPFLMTGWFWFVGMLVPVIGLVQVGEQSMADRYTYLPLIGIFIIVVWGVESLGSRVSSLGSQVSSLGSRVSSLGSRVSGLKSPGSGLQTQDSRLKTPDPRLQTPDARLKTPDPRLMIGLALAVLLACAVRTRDQLRVWHDSESLYRHAVAVSSKNFIAYQNLGAWLDNEKRTDEALTNYFKALEIQPHYPDPLNNIGCILAGRNEFADAVPYFEAALRSQPGFVDAHANLAAALFKLRRFREAIPHLRAVVKEKPEDTGALNSLGNALASQGQFAEAAQYYEASLRVKPSQVAAHYDLANALSKLRRADEAVVQYRLALQAKPDLAEAHSDLGMLLARQGKLEQAIGQLREAVRWEPRSAAFELNLGLVLAGRQDFSAAIPCYQQALQIAPNNPDAHNALGAALAITGKLDEAIVQFRETLRLRPGNASAECNLGKALAAQGKTEEAIGHLREALRLKPDFGPARQALQALTGAEPQTGPPQDSRFSP